MSVIARTAQRFTLLLCCVCLSVAAFGASGSTERPRVGLVLAGGGARGLAHIGVLRYLEEHHIRIDAVAGTSMGSIVGGLYASGLNAAEVERIARNLDWKYAFNDATPREQQSFRRKEEDYDYLIPAKLRFKNGKLGLPMGAIEGQHLNLMLHEMVAHVARIDDFDKLPIPFRAVATDITTGDAVILGKGDLAIAMRASMSIPGVFSPIELDGKLLVDGGIVKNIPVDVVQGMGVDRLIVIDIGTPLSDRDKLQNVLALVDQLTTIMTRKNSEQQLSLMRPGDVLILPALDDAGVATMSFDMADEAIALGYAAAQAMGSQLAALADPSGSRQVAAAPPLQLPRIDRIQVETDATVSQELMRNMISQRTGTELDEKALKRDIADLYGLDEFSRVDYRIDRDDAGATTLLIRGTAHPGGANYLKLGLSWDQDNRGTSEFGLRGSWRARGLNSLGGEWYTKAQVGGDSEIATQFYQPLDKGRRFFLDTRYSYSQRQLNLSDDGEIRGRALVDEQMLELAPGFLIGNFASLRAGAFAGTSEADIQIGPPEASSGNADLGGWFTELRIDTLDRAFFPRSGMRLTSRYEESVDSLGADDRYDAWSTTAYGAWSHDRSSLLLVARWSDLDLAAGSSALDMPGRAYTLGGFLNLSGYTRNSLAGTTLGMLNLAYYRRMNEQSFLPVDFPVYVGASLEAGNVWTDRHDASFDDLVHAGSVFLGVDSPIGPVYLGVGIGENNQRALYLQVGQLFQ